MYRHLLLHTREELVPAEMRLNTSNCGGEPRVGSPGSQGGKAVIKSGSSALLSERLAREALELMPADQRDPLLLDDYDSLPPLECAVNLF
jgi:hypothetical protein